MLRLNSHNPSALWYSFFWMLPLPCYLSKMVKHGAKKSGLNHQTSGAAAEMLEPWVSNHEKVDLGWPQIGYTVYGLPQFIWRFPKLGVPQVTMGFNTKTVWWLGWFEVPSFLKETPISIGNILYWTVLNNRLMVWYNVMSCFLHRLEVCNDSNNVWNV